MFSLSHEVIDVSHNHQDATDGALNAGLSIYGIVSAVFICVEDIVYAIWQHNHRYNEGNEKQY